MRFKEGKLYVALARTHLQGPLGSKAMWLEEGQTFICTNVRVDDTKENHLKYFYKFLVGDQTTGWNGFKRTRGGGKSFKEVL